MLVDAGPARKLGGKRAVVRFGEDPRPRRSGRVLLVAGEPAFELSTFCETCAFLFQWLGVSAEPRSFDEVQDRLAAGLDAVDDGIVETFGRLLERRTYLPLLLSIEPRLVHPVEDGDYFAEEQVATWGVDRMTGLPQYPATPYYRGFETRVASDAHLYEFVVPMVPPIWNCPDRVAEHAAALAGSSAPTAVAVSMLDVRAPAYVVGSDWYYHWALTHFLLDGHHKTEAAARTGRPLRLLSLLSVDCGISSREQVERVPDLLRQPPARRVPGAR